MEKSKEVGRLGRTVFSYDTVNRLNQVNYADAQVNYTYDNLNRPTQVTDTQGGTISWSYDTLGQILPETTANSVVSYFYNDARQRNLMTAQRRPSVNYSYDTVILSMKIVKTENLLKVANQYLSALTSHKTS